MNEIRYAEEPAPGPGKSRVLYADGKWLVPVHERPANWRALERPIEDAPAPPKAIISTTNQRDALHSERRVGRPRTRPPQAHPFGGRGKAWNRKESVTDEQIASLRAAGMCYAEIGKTLRIHPSTAHKRLTSAAKRAAGAERVA